MCVCVCELARVCVVSTDDDDSETVRDSSSREVVVVVEGAVDEPPVEPDFKTAGWMDFII